MKFNPIPKNAEFEQWLLNLFTLTRGMPFSATDITDETIQELGFVSRNALATKLKTKATDNTFLSKIGWHKVWPNRSKVSLPSIFCWNPNLESKTRADLRNDIQNEIQKIISALFALTNGEQFFINDVFNKHIVHGILARYSQSQIASIALASCELINEPIFSGIEVNKERVAEHKGNRLNIKEREISLVFQWSEQYIQENKNIEQKTAKKTEKQSVSELSFDEFSEAEKKAFIMFSICPTFDIGELKIKRLPPYFPFQDSKEKLREFIDKMLESDILLEVGFTHSILQINELEYARVLNTTEIQDTTLLANEMEQARMLYLIEQSKIDESRLNSERAKNEQNIQAIKNRIAELRKQAELEQATIRERNHQLSNSQKERCKLKKQLEELKQIAEIVADILKQVQGLNPQEKTVLSRKIQNSRQAKTA